MGSISVFTFLLMASIVYITKGDNPGTTPNLKDIFIGRCWDYQLIKYKQLAPTKAVQCDELWDSFFEAFSFQAPCSLAMKHYQEFMDLASQTLTHNKVMFWSGTYVIAHEYAENSIRFITLEDTLIGYLANSLVWCGSGSDPSGMNMSRCPSWTDCPLESSESFWAAASATFAKSARGTVYLVLDGSRDDKPAYSRQSFFSKYELPNLREDVSINILVTHKIGGPVKETCNNGSIVDLKEDITRYRLPIECVDDPPAIVHLLCADHPDARECHLVLKRLYREKSESNLPLFLNARPPRFNY